MEHNSQLKIHEFADLLVAEIVFGIGGAADDGRYKTKNAALVEHVSFVQLSLFNKTHGSRKNIPDNFPVFFGILLTFNPKPDSRRDSIIVIDIFLKRGIPAAKKIFIAKTTEC